MRVSIIGTGKLSTVLAGKLKQAGVDVQNLDFHRHDIGGKNTLYNTGKSEVILLNMPACLDPCFVYKTIECLELQKGVLIAMLTVMPPGTAEQVQGVMAQRDWIAGKDFFFVLVPCFREIHKKTDNMSPQLMSGLTPACISRGARFFSCVIEQLRPVKDMRIAEMVPIIENAHRFILMSFAQVIKEYCTQNQIDFSVLRMAVNMAGHDLPEVCAGIGDNLPKDLERLQSFCPSPLFVGALAADVGYRQNLYKQVKGGQKVLVIGLVSDVENFDLLSNPTAQLIWRLQHKGCQVYVQDEHISPQELMTYGFRPPNPEVKYDVIFKQGEIYGFRED